MERLNLDVHCQDRAILYRNNGGGKFTDISGSSGSGIVERHSARGPALGDPANDGVVEVIVNNQNETAPLRNREGGKGGSDRDRLAGWKTPDRTPDAGEPRD